MPAEGPVCQVWLLGRAALFLSPYGATDLGKTALKRKGDRSVREDGTEHACPVSHLESTQHWVLGPGG